jgi:magnesium transporter
MAQEDVAELLNNMAPDERTLFLEELPAEATRSCWRCSRRPNARVASRCSAIPKIGRPADDAELRGRPRALDRPRGARLRPAHGQDSETLNVIYVVDDQGSLVDDIRIREFLLARWTDGYQI